MISASVSENFSGTKLLLFNKARILTCLRDGFDHIPDPKHWDLAGGGREGNETPVNCGLRELFEESGLIIPATRLRTHHFPPTRATGLPT